MPLRERELRREPLDEMGPVQRAGQTVDDARCVEAPEELFFGLIRVGKTHEDGWAETHPIAVGEGVGLDGRAMHRRAVSGAQVLEHEGPVGHPRDARVPAARSEVLDLDMALRRPTEEHLLTIEREDRSRLRSCDHGQGRPIADRGQARDELVFGGIDPRILPLDEGRDPGRLREISEPKSESSPIRLGAIARGTSPPSTEGRERKTSHPMASLSAPHLVVTRVVGREAVAAARRIVPASKEELLRFRVGWVKKIVP